jgi:hypothetical protein
MERLQATRLQQVISGVTAGMESIFRYPDLTLLGISAEGGGGTGPYNNYTGQMCGNGGKGGGGAGSRRADTVNALGDTNSIVAGGNSSQSQAGAGAPLSGGGGGGSWVTPGAGGSGCVIFAISP